MVTYAPNTGAPLPEGSDPYRVQPDLVAAVLAVDGEIGKLQTYIQANGGVRGAGISSITADSPGVFTIHWIDPDTLEESSQTVELPDLASQVSEEFSAVQARVSGLENGALLAREDLARVEASIRDTGWVSMGSVLVSGSATQPVQVRKVGSLVTWRGVVVPSGRWPAGSHVLFENIPSEYRPSSDVRAACAVTSSLGMLLVADTAGQMRVWSADVNDQQLFLTTLSYYTD